MKNYSDITENLDITTKQYVDSGLTSKANLSGGNTFTGKQTLNSPGSDGYSINAAGYIKGSWLQSGVKSNYGSGTGMVCVFDGSGRIYYRTPAEILTEAGGATTGQIPTVNNGTLTIKQNGTTVQTFSANQKDGTTANITVPTKASDVNALSLDGGTINKSKTIKMDASANSDGANLKWGTVNHKNPYIGYASDQVDGTFVVGSLLGTNYASGLAIGGGSGNLLWKGTKVATTSDIPTVNNGTLTIQKNGTTVQTFSANQSSSVTANITVPTKTSELTNDSGFTKNTGTVTSVAVKMNGATKGTVTSSGTIDLGTVITAHQDISGLIPKSAFSLSGTTLTITI